MLVEDAVYSQGERKALDTPALRNSRPEQFVKGEFEWLGFVDPTDAEVAPYAERLGIDPLAIEDALSQSQRAKVDRYTSHYSLTVKTIAYNEAERSIDVGDVALIFSERFIFTVRHGSILPLRDVRRDLELTPSRLKIGPAVVVHEYLDRVVDGYIRALDSLQRDEDELEDLVFRHSRDLPISRAYILKREILEFRRAAVPLVDAFNTLMQGSISAIPTSLMPKLKDVYDHLRRAVDDIERMNELIDAALTSCLNLAQVQQNADMRRISAWIALAAVPTMVAGIYGMNFDHMPELRMRAAYYIVIGSLGVFSVGLFFYFRRREWL